MESGDRLSALFYSQSPHLLPGLLKTSKIWMEFNGIHCAVFVPCAISTAQAQTRKATSKNPLRLTVLTFVDIDSGRDIAATKNFSMRKKTRSRVHGEGTITCPVPETVADAAGTRAGPCPETQVLTNKALAQLVAGHCPGTFPDKGPQKRRDRCRKLFTQHDLRSHRKRVSRLSVRQRCRTNPCTGGVFADFQRQEALRPHDHPA